MHILETIKIKYTIFFQFSYNKQTKTTCFSNFDIYLRDRHFTPNRYKNVIVCDIVEIWKKLQSSSFFFKNFLVKSHFKMNNKNTENEEVGYLVVRLF